MFRIKFGFLLFFVFSFFIVMLIHGCSKAECKIDADCSQKTCAAASCVDKQCKYTTIQNCCGNQVKESIENGNRGNSCTCPQDYGVCGGKAQLTAGSRTYDAQYVERFCQNDECVLGVPLEKVRPVTLLDETDIKFFILETTATYNEPLDVTKDSFAFRISLKDDSEDIIFPVKFNKILLKDGEVLFGEIELNLVLNGVGDSFTVNVPVSYKLKDFEETRRLTYQVDYEYKKRIKDKKLENGSYSYKEELVRDDFQKRISTKITFVKSGVE